MIESDARLPEPNIFRGAESFDVSFTAGYEFMKAPDAKKKRATELGVTTD